MRELTMTEVANVSGSATNIEMCVAGSTVLGGAIGGIVGAYSTLGIGTGAGIGWGMTGGNLLGTLFCSTFFA